MGLLTKTLRVIHPVRTVKRDIKRAVIPRSVRKGMRAGHMVANPLGSVEGAVKYSVIGAIDKGITPRRRSRHRTKRTKQQSKGKGCLILVAVLIAVGVVGAFWQYFLVAALVLAGVAALVTPLYFVGKHQQKTKRALAVTTQPVGDSASKAVVTPPADRATGQPAGDYVPQDVVRPPAHDGCPSSTLPRRPGSPKLSR